MPHKFSTPYQLAAKIYEALADKYTENPKYWLKGQGTKRNRAGEVVAVCLLVGVDTYFFLKFNQTGSQTETFDILDELAAEKGHSGMISFNDAPETKRKDVIALLRTAQEKATVLHKEALKLARQKA